MINAGFNKGDEVEIPAIHTPGWEKATYLAEINGVHYVLDSDRFPSSTTEIRWPANRPGVTMWVEREKVLEAVDRERAFQLKKHKEWHSRSKTVGDWVNIIQKECSEVVEACLENEPTEVMKEILQLATVCLACLDSKYIVERNYDRELSALGLGDENE